METILNYIVLPTAASVLFYETKQLNVVGYATDKQKTKRVEIENCYKFLEIILYVSHKKSSGKIKLQIDSVMEVQQYVMI